MNRLTMSRLSLDLKGTTVGGLVLLCVVEGMYCPA